MSKDVQPCTEKRHMNILVKEAAKLLAVSEKTIYRWIKQESVPFFRVGEQYRFNRAELLEWATSKRMKVDSSMFVEPEADQQPLPSLAEALETGGIHYRVGGSTRDSVLEQVAQLVRLPEEVDRRHLLELTLAREELASTAVGGGIAIPHVRNPVLLHVTRPTLSLCYLEQPVDFFALDGQPVQILFPLFSPSIKAHLGILSRLSFVLHDPHFLSALTNQGSREEIFSLMNAAERQLG